MTLPVGKYALADTVISDEDSITVDGKNIKIYASRMLTTAHGREFGVDVVLSAPDLSTSKAAQAHQCRCRKVLSPPGW